MLMCKRSDPISLLRSYLLLQQSQCPVKLHAYKLNMEATVTEYAGLKDHRDAVAMLSTVLLCQSWCTMLHLGISLCRNIALY